MPAATLVRSALPPLLPPMLSCRGPQTFFITPRISTGTASGSEPLKTVQAVAIMPGLTWSILRISTGPERGRAISAPKAGKVHNANRQAANLAGGFILLPLILLAEL